MYESSTTTISLRPIGAILILQAMVTKYSDNTPPSELAKMAVQYTDCLLEELKKEKTVSKETKD